MNAPGSPGSRRCRCSAIRHCACSGSRPCAISFGAGRRDLLGGPSPPGRPGSTVIASSTAAGWRRPPRSWATVDQLGRHAARPLVDRDRLRGQHHAAGLRAGCSRRAGAPYSARSIWYRRSPRLTATDRTAGSLRPPSRALILPSRRTVTISPGSAADSTLSRKPAYSDKIVAVLPQLRGEQFEIEVGRWRRALRHSCLAFPPSRRAGTANRLVRSATNVQCSARPHDRAVIARHRGSRRRAAGQHPAGQQRARRRPRPASPGSRRAGSGSRRTRRRRTRRRAPGATAAPVGGRQPQAAAGERRPRPARREEPAAEERADHRYDGLPDHREQPGQEQRDADHRRDRDQPDRLADAAEELPPPRQRQPASDSPPSRSSTRSEIFS